MPSLTPIFVVGVFRSGTSLLCSLLNQNPQVALMFEADIWNFPRPLLGLRFRHNWAERLEFYNQCLSRHGIISAHDLSGLNRMRTPLDLYRALAEKKEASIAGEKSPFYCHRLNQLHQQYPNAYFIIISRPPVEIFRSVLKAAQSSRFFAKPGMLSRMIYQQEQLILQTAQIEKRGAKVFRVTYADLVDQTEKTCRNLSDFLDASFDTQMLRLNKADLSAVFKGPHFAHLRRGIIERQQYTEELVPPAIVRKLERYRHRWERMQDKAPARPAPVEPGLVERAYHTTAGQFWSAYDSLVRAGFEFLPLRWLQVYRLLKTWVVNPPSGAIDEKTSLTSDFKNHWLTILIAAALFAVTALIHSLAPPHLMFLLFYTIPCGFLALLVNARWATLFVLLAAFMGPVIQQNNSEYSSPAIFVWNCIGRFVLLEVFILMISRIRLELAVLEIQQKIASGLMSARATPQALKFSIITPSFRNSEWLKLCIASVADQKGVEFEHIVQDSCSDDGTQDWLPHDPRVKAFIEKDAGMYDAVNRGYRRATGDILAYLNCDEQYLPGALAAVEEFFQQHPQVEVLLAGSIVTDGAGHYVCHRHSLVPKPRHIWYRFSALTSSIFIRRSVIEKRRLFFDPKWRDLGDIHWVRELLRQGVSVAEAPIFTSIFADTGDNMNLKPNALREKAATQAMIPLWVRLGKPLWILNHRLRRLAHGHFSLKPMSYALYTKASPDRRVTIDVPRPTAIWWSRI